MALEVQVQDAVGLNGNERLLEILTVYAALRALYDLLLDRVPANRSHVEARAQRKRDAQRFRRELAALEPQAETHRPKEASYPNP